MRVFISLVCVSVHTVVCQCVFTHACDLPVIAVCCGCARMVGMFVLVLESVRYCMQRCNECKTASSLLLLEVGYNCLFNLNINNALI